MNKSNKIKLNNWICDKIGYMWHRIKMWWLLQDFGKQISTHTSEQTREYVSPGQFIVLSREFFIDGTDKWPGLARRSSKRFSKILFWRKKDKPEGIKKRIIDYNDILDSCIKEKYISLQESKSGTHLLKGDLYDEARGWAAGFIQVVGKKFPATWAFIAWILTVIAGVIAFILKN